jgi:hypothetical protein
MPLTIKIVDEYWDNDKQEFIYPTKGVLTLEHSLLSISKWESKWHKPYMYSSNKTPEEFYDYIKCMSIKGEPDDGLISSLSREDLNKILDYIEDPMTATTVKEDHSSVCGVPKTFVTSELLYSYMVNYRIPVEFEKWHLNRLLILIKVLNEQNKEPKKKSERELIRDYAKIREANRKKFHIQG